MGAEHDDRHVRRREDAGRTHDANELGAVEQRQLPLQHDDIGTDGADGLQRRDPVAGLVDLLHADIEQAVAHDLAHELAVVDDEDPERANHRLDFILRECRRHDQIPCRRMHRPVSGTLQQAGLTRP